MTDRPILRLPDSRPARRMTGAPARFPRPRGAGRRRQGERFCQEFDRLEAALARDDAALELRPDPLGIAPERALVFVTAVPIADFARAARLVGLEVLSEIELEEDYDLPDDLFAERPGGVSPTLYATMPTQDAFNRLLRLWCSSARRLDADRRGNVLIPLDSEGSDDDAEQHWGEGLGKYADIQNMPR